MKVQLYTINHGGCPYLERRQWNTNFFMEETFPSDLYEHLIDRGWRRSGKTFYTNICRNCSECIPIRVASNRFKPSRSQRRCLNRNRDVMIERKENVFREEEFHLLRKYDRWWHRSDSVKDEKAYRFLYTDSPVNSEVMRYLVEGRLVGVGWIDLLPGSVSSVYFAFDPDFSHRQLGTFSLLKEIELCRELDKEWLHLGFYVAKCGKMNYKNRYKPNQLLIDEKWRDT